MVWWRSWTAASKPRQPTSETPEENPRKTRETPEENPRKTREIPEENPRNTQVNSVIIYKV
jgi:hypothetical protein